MAEVKENVNPWWPRQVNIEQVQVNKNGQSRQHKERDRIDQNQAVVAKDQSQAIQSHVNQANKNIRNWTSLNKSQSFKCNQAAKENYQTNEEIGIWILYKRLTSSAFRIIEFKHTNQKRKGNKIPLKLDSIEAAEAKQNEETDRSTEQKKQNHLFDQSTKVGLFNKFEP